MKFIFADLNEAFVLAMQERMKGRNDCEYHVGDVRSIRKSASSAIFYVTPSNCLHFMKAGLDRVYTREMFPGTEPVFRNIVKIHGSKSLVGKPYIPIGDGIMINPKPNNYLISSPTMLMPQPVTSTRNAYHATLAALYLGSRLPDATLVIPAMCCGWGKMAPEESAKQVWWAILDFEAGISMGKLFRTDTGARIYRSGRDTLPEQPLFYENTEFKDIPSHLISTTRA